jgi:carbonic anhydrase
MQASDQQFTFVLLRMGNQTMELKAIFENNQKWVAEKLSHDEDYFRNLAKGQDPDILYIGCSDSRVTAEEMIGAQPGDLFVHRNIANLVPNTDINAMSVINYPVVHLKVKHIIVCGHYGCGGVKAAMQPEDLGILNPWLRNIRDVCRRHYNELSAIQDKTEHYNRLVELNVQEQCFNVLKTAEVLKAFASSALEVHGWVVDISSGQIIDLKIDLEENISQIREIYDLG